MTKDHYFEMCEALGSQPIEEEVPIDFTDFPEEIQLAFELYTKLSDRWDSMSGTYMGKDLNSLEFIMEITGTEDKRTAFEFITLIDRIRQKFLLERQKRQSKDKK